MTYVKYLLSRTGLFPRMEPGIEDVLKAATDAHEVKDIVRDGHRYYYVIPTSVKLGYLYDLVRLFSDNGVILRPHKSKRYSGWVFVVPYRGQKFMRDVAYVNRNKANFQHVLEKYNEAKSQQVTVKQKLKQSFAK